jgi:hypothetical protein
MKNDTQQIDWGIVSSILGTILFVGIPLAWRMHWIETLRKGLDASKVNREAEIKARKQLWKQLQQQPARHDLDIRYPKRQRDERFSPFRHRHEVRPYGVPGGSPTRSPHPNSPP